MYACPRRDEALGKSTLTIGYLVYLSIKYVTPEYGAPRYVKLPQ